MAGLIRRMPKRKTVKSKKIAGRFCFSRNPSGTLFPNANPETRGQFGGFFYSMPESLIRFRQTQTPRQSSSDLKFIAERQKLCKGESRGLVGVVEKPKFEGKAEGFTHIGSSATISAMCGGRLIATIFFLSASVVAAAPPAPIAAIRLDQLATECAGQNCETTTLVFLSETQLAVSLQHFAPDKKGEIHYLFVMDVGPGVMRVTAKRENFPTSAFLNGLQRTAAGKLVVVARFPDSQQFRIYDPDLEHFSGFPSNGISLSLPARL